MNLSRALQQLLSINNISVALFNRLAATEELTQEEINDIDYMEDRIDTWKDLEIV